MIKSGDSKEIRLKEFSYALERMESLKSGNELTNKIVEIQGTQIHSKGDSVPEIESINTFLTTISFAVEDLFNNTYEVIHFLRREMLDFTAFPVFFVSNLLLVQRKKYYFNRATVSRNCSIVL